MRLTQGLHRAAFLRGDKPAFCFEGRTRTWSQVLDRCARFAGALRRLGIGRDDRVAMLAHNSDRYLEYYYATVWSGGIYAPINYRWALPEMMACLENCTPRILLVDQPFVDTALTLAARMPSIRHVIYTGDETAPESLLSYETLIDETAPMEDAMRGYDDLACLFYTSGATGQPKGVMITHTNQVLNAMNTMASYGYHEDAVALHAGPLFHLATGARVITATFGMTRQVVLRHFDPQVVLRTIEQQRVTNTIMIPTMLNMLLSHPAFEDYDLSSLETLSYGGSPIAESIVRRVVAMLPRVRLLQSFGQTESGPTITSLGPKYHALEGDNAGKLRTAGRPVTNVDVRIVDENDGDLPTGRAGEIIARSPCVMKGYWGQPELSEQTLRNGWLHTGDIGWLDDDGFLTVVDRKKDMIISGGENVYSTEVEDVIYRHPAVAECAVIGIPDEKWIEAVHAIVVARPDTSLTATEIIDHCRETLSGYKCPRSVDIRHEPLPKSGATKIAKAELRKNLLRG